ncbi:hypothetical protein F2P79_012977 [Pimephales promelas]|nr:hypothetical protein F2P79_012977 [Pimephales promelas]
MGLQALLAPLVLVETLLLNMMVGKDLTLALDQWVCPDPEAQPDPLVPLDLKDFKDMLVSLESPDRLELLVLVVLLDLLAKMVKMVTMADLENLEIEEHLDHRVPVASQELLDSLA